jgi:hypothetical protein
MLLFGLFASLACIGFGVASASSFGYSSPAGDRVVALTVAGLLLIIGALGALRSLRVRVLIADDHLKIVGITRTRTIPFTNVAYVGFCRSQLGRVLYVITTDDHPFVAWGVSHSPGPEPPTASEARDQLRGAICRQHAMRETDPPNVLAIRPLEGSAAPRTGTQLVAPEAGRLLLLAIPGLLTVFVVIMITAVGLQAADPGTFPWILAAPGVLLLLVGVLPTVVLAPRLRIAAVGGGWISIRAGQQWTSLDLSQLAGVGATRYAFMVSMFTRPKTRTMLRLIDTDGDWLDVDELPLIPQVLSELRQFATGTAITDLAASTLGLPQDHRSGGRGVT